jgi:6-phosphofructokinase 1
MKRIAILTRDCAGVNAALRAAVRTGTGAGLEVLGVVRGYEGLIDGEFVPLGRRSVSNIINLGGTILKTARSERFYAEDAQAAAAGNIRNRGIDGLLVVGGNGSLRGAHALAVRHGAHVVGVPATIDNDICGVDESIGADTALNVALDAIDKIRDTATSMERIFVIEVMGRMSGSIAMKTALAGGCEEVLLPEREFQTEALCREIQEGHAKGKISWIVVVAEGRAGAADVAAAITSRTGLETRIAVLGHIQRGGRPTVFDRLLAARLGAAGVEALRSGMSDVCVHLKHGRLEYLPLEETLRPKTIDVEADYRLLKMLS